MQRHGVQVLHRLGTSDLDGFEPFGFRDGDLAAVRRGPRQDGAREPHRQGRRVRPRLPERVRAPDRAPAAGPQRQLPRLPPAGTGRPRILALPRRRDADGRRGRGSRGSPAPRVEVRRSLAERRAARARSGRGRARARRGERLRATTATTPAAPAARSARTSGGRIRATRSTRIPAPTTRCELNRRHRLLRRGREYGSPLTTEEALHAEDDGEPRGLHFICLNGNIARQFEFVQHTWLNNPKFAGLYDDADPLVGPSEPFGGTASPLPARGSESATRAYRDS